MVKNDLMICLIECIGKILYKNNKSNYWQKINLLGTSNIDVLLFICNSNIKLLLSLILLLIWRCFFLFLIRFYENYDYWEKIPHFYTKLPKCCIKVALKFFLCELLLFSLFVLIKFDMKTLVLFLFLYNYYFCTKL